jgi:uncharacterized protein (DUF952 family)
MRVLHLTTAADWAAALESGSYTVSTRGRSLEQEGFIHCSEPHQVEGVRQRFFAGVEDLVVLEVDTDLLTSPWRVEEVAGTGEAYPHVYGPLDLAAVVDVRALPGSST